MTQNETPFLSYFWCICIPSASMNININNIPYITRVIVECTNVQWLYYVLWYKTVCIWQERNYYTHTFY